MGTPEPSRRTIDPVLSIAPDRPSVSFDAFEQQQRILLDGQQRALDIQNKQMDEVMVMTLTAAKKSQEMLQVVLQASADLAAQAVAAADDARKKAREAQDAQAENAKATFGPFLDTFAAFLKEKGFMQ